MTETHDHRDAWIQDMGQLILSDLDVNEAWLATTEPVDVREHR